MGILANENAISSGGYQISNSLRFQSASSQYLTRTPASAGNRTAWTWSGWVKRGALGALNDIFSAGPSNNIDCGLYFSGSNDTLSFLVQNTGTVGQLITTQVFRDPSAWYHIVLVWDSNNATSSDRIRLYVNGSRVTAFSTATYPTLGATSSSINNNVSHGIGAWVNTTTWIFDGYQAEVNFIDGQALTPSSFGSTDPISGQWVAAKYTGTYGTNGFYLPFSNGTSTTTLGADSSGNGNNWTLTNFTRSAGYLDCWMYDVPSGNGGASGTQPSSNYCILNPLSQAASGATYLSRANLYMQDGTNAAQWRTVFGSIGINVGDGKFYFECTTNTFATSMGGYIGICSQTDNGAPPQTSDVALYWNSAGNFQKEKNGSATALSGTPAAGDVLAVAYDAVNGQIWFAHNNTWFEGNPSAGTGASYTGLSLAARPFMSIFSNVGTVAASVNFGQRSFAYTPPSGFKALCTANLPVATIKKGNQYMDATLYTGTGATATITNAGSFKPDFVWIKRRSSPVANNNLFNSVTGVYNRLFSDTTGAEVNSPTTLTAFNSNGFSLSTDGDVNSSGGTFVGWQWQAGQGTTSSNTSGSITSTVSVNATAGFSIVTYTGTGTTATIGHGLGVAPSMIITKNRSGAGTAWIVYHSALGATKGIYLNTTAATATSVGFWNNVAPTSSVFTVYGGNDSNTNGATTVAYCFAEITGFSKFGSYTGNGSADGPFNYVGFRPKFVLVKSSSAVGNWQLLDTSRSPYNVSNANLYPNLSSAEVNGGNEDMDILSNGFKPRNASASFNVNGTTYIYMAFAENPFAQANAR